MLKDESLHGNVPRTSSAAFQIKNSFISPQEQKGRRCTRTSSRSTEVFCSISHRQGDALQSCRRTHLIFLNPKAQVSKIGLFKDCIKTPFLELIQGHEAQAVPPGPGGWYGQNLRTNPHGPQDGAAGGLNRSALPWKSFL